MYYQSGVSQQEFRDLGISILVYTVAFTVWSYRVDELPGVPLYLVVVSSLMVALFAFLLHEFAHRYFARSYGGFAEFRMWPIGAFLALVTAAIGFLFAAVGAVYIQGIYDRDKVGRISLAGPATNIIVGLLFYAISLVISAGSTFLILRFVTTINFYIGFFNLLPIPPLDGYKVLMWSKEYYIVAIALSLLFLIVL